MFRGMDEADRASLRHGYGSAADVPGLLRGLASSDPAERQTALDGMYGAVHHRDDDVHDSALACVPFLLELADRDDVRDRAGVVELLVSIGDIAAARDDSTAEVRNTLRAGAGVFVRLAGDPDPAVRRVVPGALVRYADRPGRVLALLRERITVERDDGVLLALAESLGLFVQRHLPAGKTAASEKSRTAGETHTAIEAHTAGEADAAGAVRLLTELSGPPYGPGLRLAALGQLAGCAPELLPAALVPTVVGLLRERSEVRARAGAPDDCPGPDTLASRLRRLRPSDEEGSRLLRTLHSSLGSRVADRVALLCGQLTSPDPLDRCNGVWMSAGLFREWRTGHAEPVLLISNQLGAEESRLHDAAVAVLVELSELAAPAADRLHALVTYRPELRVRHGERGAPTLGGALKALAGTGDARAAAVLAEVLAGPVVPLDLGLAVPRLGRTAVPLVPALRRSLARVPLDTSDICERAVPLLSALAALGDEASLPAVLRLLRGMPDGLRRRDTVTEAAVRALGAFGGAAREAVPDLHRLLESDCAVAAADALWSITGDAHAVLPVLLRALTDTSPDTDSGHRRRAAAVLGRLGPAARPALPGLRELADRGDAQARATAACAVWRATGEPERFLPVLRSAWRDHPRTRATIAECVRALGPSGAPLHDLLRAELASPLRHRTGAGGDGIREDLTLLRTCGQALAGAGHR
ncbi:HEAT repeat domain-containing protein [Streptomyces sp. NPDC056373]|uniref:HEAT repeat domain-containing protein n=1 Tax=Streptomyces sp. NPDC056373 TaxID=3345798 RepID=UPI0035DB83BA